MEIFLFFNSFGGNPSKNKKNVFETFQKNFFDTFQKVFIKKKAIDPTNLFSKHNLLVPKEADYIGKNISPVNTRWTSVLLTNKRMKVLLMDALCSNNCTFAFYFRHPSTNIKKTLMKKHTFFSTFYERF